MNDFGRIVGELGGFGELYLNGVVIAFVAMLVIESFEDRCCGPHIMSDLFAAAMWPVLVVFTPFWAAWVAIVKISEGREE